jgi:hypothetical protein
MSLLITSNTPENDAGKLTNGINRPYSYSNNLQDTLRVPANSEIAVQSVKINRDGVISLNIGQQMGFYFGEELDDDETNRNSQSYCGFSSLLSDYTDDWQNSTGNENDNYFIGSVENVADRIEKTANKCLHHPNLCKNTNLSRNGGFTCEVKRNASTLNFEGFTFTVTNMDSTKNASHISDDWIGSSDTYTYNGTTRVLTNSTGEFEYAIGTQYPLSQADGTFSASILEEDKFQEIGLTRALGDTQGVDAEAYVPPYFDGSAEDFYDWVVEIENDNVISVYHATEDGGGDLSMVEYNYTWMNGGSKFNKKDDGIDKVEFNVKGERVKISLFAGVTEYVLTDSTNVTSASNVKPTNMNTRFLFPKIRIEDGATIGIEKFDGVDVEHFAYGNDLYGTSFSNTIEETVTPYIDWWPNHWDDPLAQQMDVDSTKQLNFTNLKGLNASGQIDYDTAIFTGFDNRYEYTTGLNTEKILGFVNRPLAFTFTEKATVSPFIITYVSDNVPQLDATSSVFVRVRNMTFDSVNFSKSALSKILYHIPTFSQTGESTGALFFEPSERVYLKLNNAVDLFLSNIDVDLVRDDETLASDITGKTTVVFHIRDAK